MLQNTQRSFEDRFRPSNIDYGQYDFYNRQSYFDELPTIQDENMTDETTQEIVTIEEEENRQKGILHSINDIDQMLKLGQMATSDSESLLKLM